MQMQMGMLLCARRLALPAWHVAVLQKPRRSDRFIDPSRHSLRISLEHASVMPEHTHADPGSVEPAICA